ncbi:MAG TPA: exodeoxyribonuclease VII small subunit [Pseudomonadales bacterium]|jgi:exodeoxyribonuclease VII small subunit|nr:exodeoxyribonuclease VII small subunit [Pseudomonadales bacterium]HNI37396.1 exodeoxyribonuclease VII small subunit [Pseudomonadales bacterium]HNN87760.1 exodeoxyribonuclease VII small subunit [Pseudomonadales bacterium]
MAGKKKNDSDLDLESALEKLELLVESLERGDLSLEESLKVFEAGIKLTRQCQETLSAAEQKVQLLVEKNGTLKSEPFDDN